MKNNLIITLIFTLCSLAVFSQAPPQAINYQAVVRDGNNQILANQDVGIRFVVKQGSASGAIVYTETFDTISNNYGLVNLKIGTGTTSDIFSDIDWSSASHFLETSMDVTGGTNYSVLGTSEFISVPYVFYAETAGNAVNDSVIDDDADPTNELQDISLNGTDLSISNGSTVDLSVLQDGTGTDDQNISGSGLSGTNLTIGIEDGQSEVIDLSSLQDGTGTDDQNISGSGLSGTNLTIGIEDGQSEVIDLSSLQDGTGTDDQNISGSGLSGTNLTIGIEDGQSEVIDLSSLQDGMGTDDQNISGSGLSGTDLTIGIEDGQSEVIDLSSLQDGTGTDNQTLSISGNQLSIQNGNSILIPSSNIWTQSGNDIYYSGGDVGIDQYITHNGDPNSYFGFPSPDDFELWLNGSNIITAGPGFFNSGSLTLNPQNIYLPNVFQGNLSTSDRVVVAGSNGGALKTVPASSLGSGGGGGGNVSGSGQTNKMAFWDSPSTIAHATEVHYDSNWGRLGINNSSPQYALHVGGDMSMNNQLVHNGDDNTYLEYNSDEVDLRAGGLSVFHAVEGSPFDTVYINSDFIRFNDVENSNGYVEINCQTNEPKVVPGQNYLGKLGQPTKRWLEGHIWNVFYNQLHMVSDERVKTNVTPLSNSLSKLMEVNLVHYDYIPELYYGTDTPSAEQIEEAKDYTGVLAQEFELVFPELVAQPNSPEEYKSVNYVGLIPHLVEAIQEQQKEIELLKAKIAEK